MLVCVIFINEDVEKSCLSESVRPIKEFSELSRDDRSGYGRHTLDDCAYKSYPERGSIQIELDWHNVS